MNPSHEYRTLAKAHLAKADELLSTANDEDLRRACLELRNSIEAACYCLLMAYRQEAGTALIATWQPKRVMQELESIDGNAHRTATIRFGKEGPAGEPPEVMHTLGEDRRMEPRWATKAYNTLGSFLHVPTLKQLQERSAPTPQIIRDRAQAIRNELDHVLSASVWNANFGLFVHFTCDCGVEIKRRSAALQAGASVECSECGRLYLTHEGEEGALSLALQKVEYDCEGCGHTQFIEAHHLKEEAEVTCTCGIRGVLHSELRWRIDQDLSLTQTAHEAAESVHP